MPDNAQSDEFPFAAANLTIILTIAPAPVTPEGSGDLLIDPANNSLLIDPATGAILTVP